VTGILNSVMLFVDFLAPVFHLVQSHPGAAVLAAFVLPWGIVGVAALLGRGLAPAAPSLPPPAPPAPETRAAPPAPETVAPHAEAAAAAPEGAAAPPPATPVPPEPPIAPAAPAPRVPETAAAIPEPVAAPPAPPRPKVRLADRLARTRGALVGRLGQLVGGRPVDAAVLEDLEKLLFSADLGVKTAESLLDAVRRDASGGDAARIRGVLRSAILDKLRRVEVPGPFGDARPHVVLVLGVNGSGKTTTIGKLAARYRAAGQRVVLGAGDTFRAAAIEQLELWGERVGCEVVKGQPGGDPAAVAFDTVKAATARGYDVAIVDTAGRLQTKAPLMEELRKIVRVIGRDCPGAPHEVLLVLDANTGQNAITQARIFTEAAGVTGLVLTKLDGTAKGGVLVGLADEFGIPVRYVGVGETAEDLRDFSADEFVDALFAESA
jgi:fused signal recognition particle receptor